MTVSPSLNASDLQQALRHTLCESEPAMLAHRLQCVLLVAQGHDCQQVADWFAISRRTVQRWVHLAALRGVHGLVDGKHTGRPGVLTQDLRCRIQRELQDSPQAVGCPDAHWSGKRLALRLSSTYGLSISVRSCQRLIAQSRLAARQRPA